MNNIIIIIVIFIFFLLCCVVFYYLMLFDESTPQINDEIYIPNKILYQKKSSIFSTYSSINPSIIKTENGYILAVRNIFKFYGEISSIELYHFTFDMKIIKKSKISDIKLHGYEDPRLFTHKNRIYAIVVVKNKNIFPKIIDITDFKINKIIEFERTYHSGNNKNWNIFKLPNCEQLYLHTDSFPIWKIFKINLDGILSTYINFDSKLFFDPDNFYQNSYTCLRCSTIPVEYSVNSHILILHTKHNMNLKNLRPKMRSVIVEIDNITLLPIRYSNIINLSLNDEIIQFVSGLCKIDNNNYLLTYGLNDLGFKIIKITKNEIEKILKK